METFSPFVSAKKLSHTWFLGLDLAAEFAKDLCGRDTYLDHPHDVKKLSTAAFYKEDTQPLNARCRSSKLRIQGKK